MRKESFNSLRNIALRADQYKIFRQLCSTEDEENAFIEGYRRAMREQRQRALQYVLSIPDPTKEETDGSGNTSAA